MSASRLVEILTALVEDFDLRNELKEVCISLYETGQITIGGRRMLISEMYDGQPYEETIGCIQIVFASSSDNFFSEQARDNADLTDEFRDLLIRGSERADLQSFLANLKVETLVSVAPKLEFISFENKWKIT